MSWGFELDQRQRKFFKVGDLDAASATISSSTECSTHWGKMKIIIIQLLECEK